MIETPLGLKNVAEICATPGLDGVYVGPSDLALSVGARFPGDPDVAGPFEEAVALIAQTAQEAGIAAGIHARTARRRSGGSVRATFATVASDLTHLEAVAASTSTPPARSRGQRSSRRRNTPEPSRVRFGEDSTPRAWMRAPERGALPLRLAATLGRTYGRVTETVQGLNDADFDRPTRCEGMPVGPLLVHLLYDAERALMAFRKSGHRRTGPGLRHLLVGLPARDGRRRSVRPDRRVGVPEAGRAWCSTGVSCPTPPSARPPWGWWTRAGSSRTQGHVLRATDFVATLVLEATVHHLDLILELPDAPMDPGDAGDVNAGRAVRSGGVGRDRLGHDDVHPEGDRYGCRSTRTTWTCSARTRAASRCSASREHPGERIVQVRS